MNKVQIPNYLLFPIRILLDHETIERIGLTSLRQERTNICIRYAEGRVLDIGCGFNCFIKEYENGIGIDVVFYPGIDVVGSGENIPFLQNTFNSIIFNGSLRYIGNKVDALKESSRVLKGSGLILILENNPLQNFLRNLTAWWTPFKGKMPNGFKSVEIISLLKESGFKFEKLVKYLYGFGRLYIGRKVGNVSY